MLDHRVTLGTDGASFYLFHPKDVNEWDTAFGWPGVRRLYAEGRVASFCTGSDGGFSFRVTDGPLTAAERKWEACRCTFRYRVRHGKAYLDGGYGDLKHASSFRIPRGDYAVTVHAIDYGEAADLTNYVVRFERVADLGSVRPPKGYPWIVPWVGDKLKLDTSVMEPRENVDLLDRRYPALVVPNAVLLPGGTVHRDADRGWYEAMFEAEGVPHVVIVREENADVGTLAFPCYAHQPDGRGPWDLGYRGERVVRVQKLTHRAVKWTATVATLDRPASTVPTRLRNRLLTAFARVVQSSPAVVARFMENHPKFEQRKPAVKAKLVEGKLEEMAEMKTPTGLFLTVLPALALPPEAVLELYPLSDVERFNRLIAALGADSELRFGPRSPTREARATRAEPGRISGRRGV